MAEEPEYRCFIGGLAWSTSDRGLKEAFDKYGKLVEAKVVIDKLNGRSRGFGFVTFEDKKGMDEAIEEMNGVELDGRTITVDKAQPNQGGSGRDGGRDRGDRGRDSGRGGGGGGGDCFKCGKPGHFARECPGEGGRGGKYGGREDRYSGGGGSRYGSERNGDRSGGRSSRDGGSRGDRDRDRDRERSGPYDRRSSGGDRNH